MRSPYDLRDSLNVAKEQRAEGSTPALGPDDVSMDTTARDAQLFLDTPMTADPVAEALIVGSDRTPLSGADAGQCRLLGAASVFKRAVWAMRQRAEAAYAAPIVELEDIEALEAKAARMSWSEPDFLPPVFDGGARRTSVLAGLDTPAAQIVLVRDSARPSTWE
jgi:hypothetical protein